MVSVIFSSFMMRSCTTTVNIFHHFYCLIRLINIHWVVFLYSFIAMTFAGRLEKLLCEVERETFQHLQLRFPLFLASPEYVYLVAQEKAEESKKVRSFRSFNSFLDYVKENNESPFLDGRSVDEVLEYKFGPQEPDLRAFVKGKVFVYHGEEFTLHLNRYGSFCGDDDVSDDGHQEKSASRENYPSPIPESLTPDGISVRTPDIESLCDLYPTLSVRSAEPIVRPISITKSFLDKRRQSNRWEESLHSLAQDEPECSKAAFQLPFMVDCLSPRHCVQLSMLLCSNMYVEKACYHFLHCQSCMCRVVWKLNSRNTKSDALYLFSLLK